MYPLPCQQGATLRPYLLLAVPQTLIDRVISLLDEAGFELQALELGPFSLLRFLADELISLGESELYLVLELLPDYSQLCVVSSNGPIRFERLSAIRDFPEPDLDDEQRMVALEAGLSAEEMTLKDENYLPISELDLRAVVRDVKAVMSELMSQSESTSVRGLSLTGINSAHPQITDLFQDALGCAVKELNPVLMPRVAGFSPDDLLVQAGLARLMGLGLGFLPLEQLLSCARPDVSTSLSSVPLVPSTIDPIIDTHEKPSIPQLDLLDVEVEQFLPYGSGEEAPRDVLDKQVVANSEELRGNEEPERSGEEKEWPSVGLNLEDKEELVKPEELRGNEEPEGNGEEKEWPSVGLNLEDKEELVKPEELRGNEEPERIGEEKEWPSVGSNLEDKEELVKLEELRGNEEPEGSGEEKEEDS